MHLTHWLLCIALFIFAGLVVWATIKQHARLTREHHADMYKRCMKYVDIIRLHLDGSQQLRKVCVAWNRPTDTLDQSIALCNAEIAKNLIEAEQHKKKAGL